MKLTIDVREEHIKAGHRAEACACPIALALMTANVPNPRVGTIYLSYGQEHRNRWFFTQDVVSWIEAFDYGEPVFPFSFEIELEPLGEACDE